MIDIPHRPFVAIVGGFFDLDEAQPDLAREARAEAVEIGRELARRNFGLIAYFHDERSLEPYVVKGYAEAADAEAAEVIRVIYPVTQGVEYPEQSDQAKKRLFIDGAKQIAHWEETFYDSIARDANDGEGIDGMLLIAGGNTTHAAGHIAHARGLPILAVDAFGGSAEKLREALPSTVRRWSSRERADHVADFHRACVTRITQRREAAAEDARRARAMSRDGKLGWLAALFALMAAAVLVPLIIGDMARPYFIAALLASILLSGATGGMIAAVVWGNEGRSVRYSALMGAIAAFAVGLAYLTPIMLSASGLLEAATPPSIADKATLVAVALLTLSAGMGFETVLTRLRAEAERAPVTAKARD